MTLTEFDIALTQLLDCAIKAGVFKDRGVVAVSRRDYALIATKLESRVSFSEVSKAIRGLSPTNA